MTILGSIFQLVDDLVELPFDVAKDVLDLGGTVSGEKARTPHRIGNILEDAGDVVESMVTMK